MLVSNTGSWTRDLSRHQPADNLFCTAALFLRLLQVIFGVVSGLRAHLCDPYLEPPGDGRVGTPRAPATGHPALYLSSAVPALFIQKVCSSACMREAVQLGWQGLPTACHARFSVTPLNVHLLTAPV